MTVPDRPADRMARLRAAPACSRWARRAAAIVVAASAWAGVSPVWAGASTIGALTFALTDTDLSDGLAPEATISFQGGQLFSYWVLESGGYQDSGYGGTPDPDRAASMHLLGSATAYDADGGISAVSDGQRSVWGDTLLFSSGSASDQWSISLAPHTSLTITAQGWSSGQGSAGLRLSDGVGSWSDVVRDGSRGLRIVWDAAGAGGTAQFVRTAEATFTPSAVSPVPEPASASLVLAGLLTLAFTRRWRRPARGAAGAASAAQQPRA